MSQYVVGVDGGTSKTIALVADDRGCILGAGRSGNSNCSGPEVEEAMDVVVAAVQEALDRAGLGRDAVAVGVFGLAGADWPEDYDLRRVVLERNGIAQRVIIKNDALVGWRVGTRQRYGVVIAAGTGTNTAVITPDGREWCYGWYAFEGGGLRLGMDAAHAVLRQEDGRGVPTLLTDLVLRELECPTAESMLRAMVAGEFKPGRMLSLCSLVFEAAALGDKVAIDILIMHGEILAEYATAAIRRFGMQDLEFDVVLSGGVYRGKGTLLIDTITQAIHRVAPKARIVQTQFEPAVGGVLLAYDALDLPVTDEMYDNLVRTQPASEFFSTVDGDEDDDGWHRLGKSI